MSAYPPSFDGNFMFGEVTSMSTGEPEREVQENTYFGLNGIETVNGGGRGRKTQVAGLLIADNLIDFNLLEQNFYNYLNAGNYILVDSQGRTWGNVRLVAYSPSADPLKQDVMTGEVMRHYSATFRHMV